jgi:CRISPR/Cas system-associated endoribonuclease Cas2
MKTSRNKLLAISALQYSVFESSTSPDDVQKLKDKFVGSTQQLQSEFS